MTDNLIGKRVSVLDKGWIELVDLMPHPATGVSGDLAIVNAARVSFLGESKGPEQDKKLLFYLLRNKHTSPFEMAEFKMRVRAPAVTWWQWVRHRAASYNLQSRRYTEVEDDELYTPDVWRGQSANNKQGSDGTVGRHFSLMLDYSLKQHYEQGLRMYKGALEMGVAREEARLFLPGWAVYTTGIVKVDAWNLMGFLRQRMAADAQYEIRVYAQAIYDEFFKVALPWTAEAFEQYVLNK